MNQTNFFFIFNLKLWPCPCVSKMWYLTKYVSCIVVFRLNTLKLLSHIFPVFKHRYVLLFYIWAYVKSSDSRRGANIDPGDIIWAILVEVHNKMIHSKHFSSRPCSFWQNDLFFLINLCKIKWPPGWGQY